MQVLITMVLGVWLLTCHISASGQTTAWRNFVALESSRENVEKILGKPDKYFETYGTYETEEGRFSVWYTKGGCHKGIEGLQWNVSAQKMASLLVYPKKSLPLEHYVTDIHSFNKSYSPFSDEKYWYISPDTSIRYETIVPKDSVEFVYSISIEPGKDKQHLLCKGK